MDADDSTALLRFMELSRAFMPSRCFTMAVKLGLYTHLQERQGQTGRGVTCSELAQQLGLCASAERAAMDFLDLLVACGTLQREGIGAEALYSNTPAGTRYLCRHSPEYMGGIAVVNHDRTYPQFLHLEHALRNGELPLEWNHHHQQQQQQQQVAALDVVDMFRGEDPAQAEAFALGMTGCNQAAFEVLARKFPFSRYSTLSDMGGSAGCLSACVAAAHPHINCTTLDLPAVHGAAERYLTDRGLQDRVKVQDIDFFKDPFPPSDCVTMSMILHDWGMEKKLLLMHKAYAALQPGGAFIAVDCIIDDERRRNVTGLAMSIDMLLEFGNENAHDYTLKDFQEWASKVGFASTELYHLLGPSSAAVAYKPL